MPRVFTSDKAAPVSTAAETVRTLLWTIGSLAPLCKEPLNSTKGRSGQSVILSLLPLGEMISIARPSPKVLSLKGMTAAFPPPFSSLPFFAKVFPDGL